MKTFLVAVDLTFLVGGIAVESKTMTTQDFSLFEGPNRGEDSCPMSDPRVLIVHPDRSRGDMCPGALRLHHAVDGAIGRVRFPGGRVLPEQWAKIARIAEELGDGTIHITTRGNMQFRGVQAEDEFASVVEDAGFLPSRSHDKVRNILASPLSPQLWELTDQLDAALLADEVVAGLSGRTLFGFDAGTGDVLSKRPDFGVFAASGGFWVILAGELCGLQIERSEQVAEVLTAAARWWQLLRGASWRMWENPEAVAEVVEKLKVHPAVVVNEDLPQVGSLVGVDFRPIGWLEDSGAAGSSVVLGAGLRFGFLSAQVAQVLSVVGKPTTITPWASIVIHDLDEAEAEQVVKVLAPLGLVFDVDSPWLKVTACTGLPGCAKSHSDTHADATEMIRSRSFPDGLVHFSGCDRRCGHPLSSHTEYVATADGEYEVAIR